ncbi:helix-turn-helix domain-containing protein [Streptosporangium fragile]|uniref:Helix-turn-helix domain-containing protein n=1 Tax=Streptosporangium fragile TaxID=46186 RepID=A0ABN3VYP1_9ACTN
MEGSQTLRRHRTRLELEWARWLEGGHPRAHGPLREEIVDSWSRSIATVRPEQGSAPEAGEARHRWRHSPLREPLAAVAGELRAIADDGGFIAAVTDETGTIMWTCGGRVMRRRAEAVNFAPGGRWDEQAMGTNALSLALRTGRPTRVFSAEHLVRALHGWVCYCAPIRAPGGRILGVLDLSSTWERSHPLAMPALRTLVGAIEDRLAERLGPALPGVPAGPPPIGGPGPLGAGGPAPPGSSGSGLRLRALGEAELTRDGVPVRLRPRQLEILTLLALEGCEGSGGHGGRGMSPERLRDELYGERHVTPATLKAEVSHLRRALAGALATRRYELTEPVGCDAVEVLAELRAGRVEEAARRYGGPLLPWSDAPGIRTWREHIEVAVREAVLRWGGPGPVLRLGELHPYDLQVHERALAILAPDDPRRAVALARYHTARDD